MVLTTVRCYIIHYKFQQGISYEYEANYEVNTSAPDFRAYQPDFYLPNYAIYIKHFGVDENSHTPPFITRDFEQHFGYVALTRAKHHVYLITDADKASIFVRELIKDNYDVVEEQPAGYEFQSKIADIPCSRCKTGYMVARTGEFDRFYGCSDYPRCKHRQSACKWCGGGLKERGDIRACENTNCDYIEPICPKCQGAMKLKKGQNGTFWGCSNYRRDSQFSCSYTKKFIDLKSSNK